jgi:hypothetical protein
VPKPARRDQKKRPKKNHSTRFGWEQDGNFYICSENLLEDSSVDVTKEPLFEHTRNLFPLDVVDGLPALTEGNLS